MGGAPFGSGNREPSPPSTVSATLAYDDWKIAHSTLAFEDFAAAELSMINRKPGKFRTASFGQFLSCDREQQRVFNASVPR